MDEKARREEQNIIKGHMHKLKGHMHILKGHMHKLKGHMHKLKGHMHKLQSAVSSRSGRTSPPLLSRQLHSVLHVIT